MFLTGYTTQILYKYPVIFPFIILLPLPGSLAWVHQFFTKKDNPRPTRYTTGYLIGVCESFAIGCIIWWDLFLLIVFSFYFICIGSVALLVLIKAKTGY